jgi:hypothetical protein
MNDDLMLDYLLQMGAMQPEQQDLKRKQAMVDALRANSMNAPQGQMIGKHYVPPSLTQYAAQLGQGAMAAQQQQGVDRSMTDMNARQGSELRRMQELLRRQRMGMTNPTGAMDTTDYGAGY